VDEITKEIEAMAEKLSKSVEDPKETLFKTIQALGKDGIRARLASLSPEEKGLLKAALEEMNLKKSKSVEMDKEAQGAKVIQGNIMDTIIQEEVADDDADEKLVKPEAAKHSHQGNSVDGWDGQVIKAEGTPVQKKDMKAEEKQQESEAEKVGTGKKGKPMKKSSIELVEQMNKSEDILVKAIERMSERGMDKETIKKNLESVGVDSEKIEKAMKKDEAKKKIMAMEEKEHGTKDPKKLVDAEKKENDKKDMKKSEEVVVAAEITEVKKSIEWTPENALLKANTFGRNFHFNVGDFVESMLKADEEAKKARKDGKEPKEDKEEKEPKEMKKSDINDLIEKSQDRSWFQEDMTKSLTEADGKRSANLVKSFDEVADMATLLGISVEDAKKILG
jgi:hypothetical protein